MTPRQLLYEGIAQTHLGFLKLEINKLPSKQDVNYVTDLRA